MKFQICKTGRYQIECSGQSFPWRGAGSYSRLSSRSLTIFDPNATLAFMVHNFTFKFLRTL